MPIRRILSIFRPLGRFERVCPRCSARERRKRKCVKGLLLKHCTAPRQSDHRTACAVRGRDLVSMALRNALRRAASAAPWATAAPRSLNRPEAGCRAVCSASSARRLAPITPGAACWKSGRSFAAAAECASPPFRPPSHDPREECRTRATRRGARRAPASRAARAEAPRAIVKIFFPEARRFAFPKRSRVFLPATPNRTPSR